MSSKKRAVKLAQLTFTRPELYNLVASAITDGRRRPSFSVDYLADFAIDDALRDRAAALNAGEKQ